MALRVIGAGLARTGTTSLKLALEQLLGGPCYHMFELFAHPGHIPAWHQAARSQLPDWDELLGGYRAAVDVPASAFWQELATANPDALIILSVRDSAGQWWDSASQTVASPVRPAALPPEVSGAGFEDMIAEVLASRFGMTDLTGKDAMMRAYERHNDTVRALAPPGRLLEWRPADGWPPITSALGLPVPAMPSPKVNTRAEFRARFLADRAGPGEPVHPAAAEGPGTMGEPCGWRVLGFGRKPEVAAAIQDGLRAQGIQARAFALTDDADGDARLVRELLEASYDGVAIGGFINGQNPDVRPTFETTLWFNRVLNIVHRHAPDAKIILVREPADALPAIQRVLGPAS